MTEKSKAETLRRKLRRRAKKGEEVDGDISRPGENNFVAKHMNTFNKPKQHADLTKDHARKDKYRRWRFGEDVDD